MAAQGSLPFFDGLLQHKRKDTVVIITEDDEGALGKRPLSSCSEDLASCADQGLRMEAHWVILWSMSSVFRAQVRPGYPLWSCCHPDRWPRWWHALQSGLAPVMA
jgi:hypothetical protein